MSTDKNPHAVALGRLGGRSGRGDAKRRDPAKLSAAGKKGMATRWKNHRKQKQGKD